MRLDSLFASYATLFFSPLHAVRVCTLGGRHFKGKYKTILNLLPLYGVVPLIVLREDMGFTGRDLYFNPALTPSFVGVFTCPIQKRCACRVFQLVCMVLTSPSNAGAMKKIITDIRHSPSLVATLPDPSSARRATPTQRV